MPRWLSLQFCGLFFRIDSDRYAKHKGKRIKVTFKNQRESVFNIDNGEILKGEVSNNPLKSDEIRLAQQIIILKKAELLAAWNQLKSGELFENKKIGHEKSLKDWLEE